MDGGIIVQDGTAIDKLYNSAVVEKKECTLFTDFNGAADAPIPQTWFLMAERGSRFIGDWLKEFERACNMGFAAYTAFIKSKLKHTNYGYIYDEYYPNGYLTPYACGIWIQHAHRGIYRLKFENQNTTMFKAYANSGYKNEPAVNILANQ